MPSCLRLRVLAVAALLPLCASALLAEDGPVVKPPTPSISLPLEPLGYRAITSNMALRAGYTNATVHFIDNDHLLLTYTAKKLIRRSPDQRESDDDHLVCALVVHLPDGKVVRETEWRLHDRAPYLWPLPQGRFLLRVRNDLYSLDPMGSFDPGHLGQRLLVEQERDLVTLELSPSRDTLLMETSSPHKIGDDPSVERDRSVAATFYRVVVPAEGAVQLVSRGRAESQKPFTLAFTSTGVLETVKEDRTHWGFDFHPYTGKSLELAGFTSTCRPSSYFLSETEFFALGCRGGEERKLMGGFNLLGEAKWVFTIDDEPLWLDIVSSVSTGRFAVRSTLTTVSMQGYDKPDAEEIRGEEIRVYGNRDGDELLRVMATPVQRPAGNFALSEDGLRLAVYQGPALNVYQLPPVSSADRKTHEKEQVVLPPLRPAADANIAASLSGP